MAEASLIERLPRQQKSITSEQGKAISQSSVRQSVSWVLIDSLLEETDGLLYAVRCSFIPVVPALEIQLIRYRVLRIVMCAAFLS